MNEKRRKETREIRWTWDVNQVKQLVKVRVSQRCFQATSVWYQLFTGLGASQSGPSFLDMFFGPSKISLPSYKDLPQPNKLVVLVDNTQTKNEDTSETKSEENDDLSEGYSTSSYKENSSSVQRGSSDPRSTSQPKRHTSCSSLVTG